MTVGLDLFGAMRAIQWRLCQGRLELSNSSRLLVGEISFGYARACVMSIRAAASRPAGRSPADLDAYAADHSRDSLLHHLDRRDHRLYGQRRRLLTHTTPSKWMPRFPRWLTERNGKFTWGSLGTTRPENVRRDQDLLTLRRPESTRLNRQTSWLSRAPRVRRDWARLSNTFALQQHQFDRGDARGEAAALMMRLLRYRHCQLDPANHPLTVIPRECGYPVHAAYRFYR